MSPRMMEWLKAALVRALRTMAQTAVALMAGAVVMRDVDWLAVGSASLLAGIISLLTSLAGLPEVAGGQSVISMASSLEEDQNA